MNDAHVENLCDGFMSEDPTVIFENAQSLILTLGSFDVEVKDGFSSNI
jgi:hypothetical protein